MVLVKNQVSRAKLNGRRLVVELSESDARQWKAYKKRHNLTDGAVFRDMYCVAVEPDHSCDVDGTKYYGRYWENIDQKKCPKCRRDLNQQVRKVHPEIYEPSDPFLTSLTNAEKYKDTLDTIRKLIEQALIVEKKEKLAVAVSSTRVATIQ